MLGGLVQPSGGGGIKLDYDLQHCRIKAHIFHHLMLRSG